MRLAKIETAELYAFMLRHDEALAGKTTSEAVKFIRENFAFRSNTCRPEVLQKLSTEQVRDAAKALEIDLKIRGTSRKQTSDHIKILAHALVCLADTGTLTENSVRELTAIYGDNDNGN